MLSLDELIIYWTERQSLHPPISPHKWSDILNTTIYYLGQLFRMKGGQQ